MREILFRGKRVDNGEWVYGSFCMDAREQFDNLCCCDGFIRLYDKNKGKMQMHEVERATVGQYTGLKDKNGQRIFEGDIVEGYDFSEDDGFGLVRWDDGGFWVGNDDWWGTFSDNYDGDSFEVIGNIHDNPELVERKCNDNGKSNKNIE